MEQPYLNREIDERLNDIKELTIAIKKQTTLTNGRVTKLERWQSYVIGFCACVLLVLLPLTLMVAQTILQK